MSMLCSLYRLTLEEAASVQTFPDAAGELLGHTPPPPKVGFLSKVFGKSQKEVPASREKLQPVGESDTFNLDQAWHILHYLFTGGAEEGKWPAAFIMSGGQEVGPDLGYGAPRLLTSEQSSEVAAFLNAQTLQSLDDAYSTQGIEAAQIYWQASSDPAERQRELGELWGVVQELRIFIGHFAQTGNSALVHIY
ncbi:YfbM family protein [Hydrogenophaga sp.]|uniref:YfbM family protein n=1 Tax=Hydrogenophaga sp. TaxID=1904254 RepID=UPI0025BE54D2|nr:YfbM family protein [Hydrogenophaga sp.]MBT9466690.1 YfbM family protein [Hydrogenophaga sp.]